MRSVPIIYSRTFCIYRHTCHIRVYIMWFTLICNALWRLIYFVDLYAQVLGFSMFQWIFLSEVYGFGQFATKWSSNPHLKHVFNFWPSHSLHLLLELRGTKGGFYSVYPLLLFLKAFISWLWISTATEILLIKNCSLIISDWIFQIQIINL